MKAVFDTNILIDHLNGIPQAKMVLEQYEEKAISIITYIEVMVGTKSAEEEKITRQFLSKFRLVELTENVANMTTQLRKQHKRKLPDTIIYATAKVEQCMLVTRNTKDFSPDLPDVHVPYQVV